MEKLQTAEGQKLLEGLVKSIAPHAVSADGQLEPFAKPAVTDQFENAIVGHLFDTYAIQHDVRDETINALASQFARLTDASGGIDLKAAQKALGANGVRFLQQLSSITQKSGDPLADRRSFEVMGAETAALIAGAEPIAPKMAALEAMVKLVAKPGELKGFQFMGLQHLFASSGTLFQAICKLGVKHDDMRFIGKVYSSNHRVVAELESKGATVDHVSVKVGAKDFAAAMDESIEAQLKGIIDTLPRPTIFSEKGREFAVPPTPQVLLIDDGAEAIRVLH